MAKTAQRRAVVAIGKSGLKCLVPAVLAASVLTACGDGTSSADAAVQGPGGNDPGGAKSCLTAAAEAADFYTPPASLPAGRPGDLIRCESVPTTVSLLASATRIMYRSTDVHGKPIAVTGIVLNPALPWTGSGERPLVGYTVGTHGQGDQCAPSRLLTDGVHFSPPLDIFAEYETPFMLDLLSQGMAVVITDYEGFGTPAVHTYLNPIAQAHADIDAVRAAQRLEGTGIPAQGPVAFAGYSQGGSAAGGTAEQVGSYAPELNVVGVYVGAPPVDIPGLFRYLDGTAFTGVMGYFLNGLATAFPETETLLAAGLNTAGQRLRAATANQCIVETLATYGYRQSNSFTASGQSIPEMLEEPALSGILSEFELGNRRPAVPVLLATGNLDEIVPPDGVRQLAADWCAQGATVELYNIPLSPIPLGTGLGHIVNAPLAHLKARGWLRDRFEGAVAPSNCR
ncbi:MAG TPA: alpha/beta fold hydrolase [Solimonas sp.]|nr:alpha/beta fold hydrolase [Solimonas sp.]